jgi:aspartate/methionine/tyrosine aminotransferase
MEGIAGEGRGPVRFGPHAPEIGLPTLPDLVAECARAADLSLPELPGGDPALRSTAAGYWWRRGLPTRLEDVAAAPGAQPLLLALLASFAGDILMPRPCPAWCAPQARLLGRPAFLVPTPAECGGVPDPYALLETIRRIRAEGGRPQVLLLSLADDPTGTVAPPELVREACEAAVGEGLHVISDETWIDTLHRPDETVPVSPAGMWPGEVIVVSDTVGSLLPAAWPMAIARFPTTGTGTARRARTVDILTALGAVVAAPVAAVAARALAEPAQVVARAETAAALHGRVAAAVHRTVLAAGALARPPRAGRHVYVDLAPLRVGLSVRGVNDSMELENHLSGRLGTLIPGGHRFGDELGALRVRLSTGPLLGSTSEQRLESLTAEEPLELPHIAEALGVLADAFDELR